MRVSEDPAWTLQVAEHGRSWDEWRSRLRATTRLPQAKRDESWKYTRIGPFEWSGDTPPASPRPIIQRPKQRSVRHGDELDWLALSFRQAFEEAPDRLIPWLGQVALASGRALSDWNTKAFEDGILVDVPDGVVVDEPIEILLGIQSPNDSTWRLETGPRYLFPRILIHLGKGAQASVIERHRWGLESPPESARPVSRSHRINAVTEILLGRDAALTHYLEQTGDGNTQAFGLTAIRLEGGSHYRGYTFDASAALLRHEHHLLLAEPGSEAQLDGLTLAGRGEHHDRQTWIVHACPGTSSQQCFHSIVAGRGMSIYGGQVLMKPGASGCNATQKNHHLLLDPTAQSRSRPSLEIAVDDVRCSHGSTSGALDPESLFYLRARGLDETQARHLLTLAFAGGFLERLPNDSLKTSWQQAVRRILPGME